VINPLAHSFDCLAPQVPGIFPAEGPVGQPFTLSEDAVLIEKM
jgi:hypothetical protein